MVFEGKFYEIGQLIITVPKQYLGCLSTSNLVSGYWNQKASRAANLHIVADGLTACIILAEKCLLKGELMNTSENLKKSNRIDYRHNGSENVSG